MWQKSLVLRRLVTCYLLLVTFLLFTIHYPLSTAVYAFCFDEAGEQYGINPILLKSIARIESNFNPKAINKNQNGSIDIGLMQINSFWVKHLGLDADELISNPCYNTMTGAKILKQCIDRHGYTWEAVGCYNATSKPKKVRYSWKIFNRLKTEDKKQSDRATERHRGPQKIARFFGVQQMRSPESDRRQDKNILIPTQNSKLKTQNSEFYFSARDKISSHEPSAQITEAE